MSVQAVRRPLFLAFALASVAHANTNTPTKSHTPPTQHTLPSPLLPSPPSPMLKQLCPVCESSAGSVRVIDDAVSAGNMF